jgi:uncharacterized SAM-dependent methyltransferase
MMGSLGNKAMMPEIIDIRSDTTGFEIKQHILSGLKGEHEKTLPTLLLYDDQGLRLFEEITYLDEYYLTEEEIAILEQYADRIADRIPDGSLIVELGSGYVNFTKLTFFTILLLWRPKQKVADACIETCERSRSY